MNSDFDAVASSRVNLSRSVMTDLRLGLARALSPVIGMAVLALLASGSDRAKAAALDDAIERYRPYLIEGIDQALAGARDLRSKAAAHDVAGARRAWLAARAGWERSEVFTSGFVPELDSRIDAWPDATTGFHAIEAKLFGAGTTDVAGDADALVMHLDDLHDRLRGFPLTSQGLMDGIVRLAYEVGESKSDGGESRISGTSLEDMRNNVAGIEFAHRTLFADSLNATDRGLAGAIDRKIDELKALVSVKDLRQVDIPKLRRTTEELVVALQGAAARIGLKKPTLEQAQQQ
jgi:iron uptake system component EfeO